MKWSDIPKFQDGKYTKDVALRDLQDVINQHLIEDNLELNPDFQRGHVWSEDQQSKYVEFLLRGGKSAIIIYFNHPNWMGSFEGQMVCVDGLQRLTACLRFLNNEIRAFDLLCNEFEGNIPSNIHLVFNIHNLKTKKEVLQWYLDFNTGGTVHSQSELQRVAKMLEQES